MEEWEDREKKGQIDEVVEKKGKRNASREGRQRKRKDREIEM